MDDEIDPEVAADIAKRDASEIDRTRTRPTNLQWSPPVFVATWACRGCKLPVLVTQDPVDYAAKVDGWLATKDEKPIDRDKIVFCDDCRKKGRAQAAVMRRKQNDRIMLLISELRGGATHPTPPGPPPTPQREREIIRDLIALDHPDIEGLVKSLRERRGGGKGPRTKL